MSALLGPTSVSPRDVFTPSTGNSRNIGRGIDSESCLGNSSDLNLHNERRRELEALLTSSKNEANAILFSNAADAASEAAGSLYNISRVSRNSSGDLSALKSQNLLHDDSAVMKLNSSTNQSPDSSQIVTALKQLQEKLLQLEKERDTYQQLADDSKRSHEEYKERMEQTINTERTAHRTAEEELLVKLQKEKEVRERLLRELELSQVKNSEEYARRWDEIRKAESAAFEAHERSVLVEVDSLQKRVDADEEALHEVQRETEALRTELRDSYDAEDDALTQLRDLVERTASISGVSRRDAYAKLKSALKIDIAGLLAPRTREAGFLSPRQQSAQKLIYAQEVSPKSMHNNRVRGNTVPGSAEPTIRTCDSLRDRAVLRNPLGYRGHTASSIAKSYIPVSVPRSLRESAVREKRHENISPVRQVAPERADGMCTPSAPEGATDRTERRLRNTLRQLEEEYELLQLDRQLASRSVTRVGRSPELSSSPEVKEIEYRLAEKERQLQSLRKVLANNLNSASEPSRRSPRTRLRANSPKGVEKAEGKAQLVRELRRLFSQ